MVHEPSPSTPELKARRRKLVVDPNLVMSVDGSRRARKRARADMIEDYRAGRVELSPVYRQSPEAKTELRTTA